MRLHVVPVLITSLFKLASVRRLMFKTISQTTVNYRGSPLSEGRAGEVSGGDRLPWVKLDGVGADNFETLTSMDWQVHIYGDTRADVQSVCDARKLPLHAFPWRSEMERVGLQRNAAYLVRPDGYVALANSESSGHAIESYLDQRKITPSIATP